MALGLFLFVRSGPLIVWLAIYWIRKRNEMNYSYDLSGNVTVRTIGVVAPQITGQPVQQVAAPGDIVTFSVVVANAHAVTFQWKRNGADIHGATGDRLLLTNISIANEGQYSVVVTNSVGSVTSAPAALLLDSDRDGLPDVWEAANFIDPDQTHPLHPANQRSETDSDKDGISNLDEFLDGTDPISSASLHPRLIVYSGAGGSVTVTPMKLSYDLGESVTLTPHPTLPTGIVRWAGDLSGSDSPTTIRMDRHKTVRASFASAVPLPPGLIAHWRGETNANDLIGGHHGTFFAGTAVAVSSVTSTGKVGGAFTFDGTVHVRVPDPSALKPERLTVEAWVFPTAPSGGFQAIIARGSSNNDDDTWYLGLLDSIPQFWSHGNNLLECPFAIPLNEWTHLAITFDGLTKRLYVNGVEVASNDEFGPLVYDAAPVPVTIASDWAFNTSNARFNGRIDELALYNRALTADEILSIYNADFAGKNFSQPYFTSPARLPGATLGDNYSQQLTTVLGTSPVSFLLLAGVLPPSLTLTSAGVLSGVPTDTGSFTFVVRAIDGAGQFNEQRCTLQVF
jgi:hypothetical protein